MTPAVLCDKIKYIRNWGGGAIKLIPRPKDLRGENVLKKCGFWKKALVYLSVMAMTPQSIVALGAELTAEAMEPDSDVLVRWIPDEEEVRTGEEGSLY